FSTVRRAEADAKSTPAKSMGGTWGDKRASQIVAPEAFPRPRGNKLRRAKPLGKRRIHPEPHRLLHIVGVALDAPDRVSAGAVERGPRWELHAPQEPPLRGKHVVDDRVTRRDPHGRRGHSTGDRRQVS